MSQQPLIRLVLLTTLTMLAFAANSLLCRQALNTGSIGSASFTLVRMVSGALVLWLLVVARSRDPRPGGSWLSAAALFGYAISFSFAYQSLRSGTGALLLFGAVQTTMIGYGVWSGERFNGKQLIGAILAGFGLVWLLLPGATAPPLSGAVLMLLAGFSWGVYSLLGRAVKQPTVATAGNFVRAVPPAIALYLLFKGSESVSWRGSLFAAASGAIASGLGYALWYSVLPGLRATTAATVQLSVPVIAAFGGFAWLGEPVTARLVMSAMAVLIGIGIVVTHKPGTSGVQGAAVDRFR